MKIKSIRSLSFAILVFLCHCAIGQNMANKDTIRKVPSIYLIAKNYGDSVVLRWGPTDAVLWSAYNKSGYVIERFEISDKMTEKPIREKLTVVPIKPWTLEEWKTKSLPNDSMAAVAAQLLYGKSKIPVANTSKKKQNTEINIGEAFDQKFDMENRFSLALFMADNLPFIAKGMGLRHVDKNFKKGKTYIYSIHALTDPKLIASDSAAFLVNTSKKDPLPEMPEILYQELDKFVKFSWNRVIADQLFSSYYYERSMDGGKTYKRLNSKPYLQPQSADRTNEDGLILLTDSLPFNYIPYYYRVIGVTPFGDYGKPSPPMLVVGRDKTPPLAPVKLNADYTGKTNVKITWQKPVKDKDLAGYIVGRSDDFNGPFVPLTLNLLNANTTEFVDTEAITWGKNFYVVSAVDTASNAGVSMPVYAVITDTIAPSKPIGLMGKIDTTGIVHVNWKLGKERDLMGYIVYFANARDHTFAPLTRDFLVDSTFTDSISLNNLTKNIYYRIVAFDRNRNPSPYSEILELKKPDKIPPVAPVFISFLVSDTAVVLQWVPSSSGDAIRQKLFRREPEKEWLEISTMENSKKEYIDATVKKKTVYEYSLIAFDVDGNHSERSFPLNVRVYDSGIRKNITSFTGKLEPDGKTVTLNWNNAVSDDYTMVLYRSVNGSGMQMYESIPANKSTFKDSNLKSGKYGYAIKAIYNDGSQSPLTKAVNLNVN